LNIKDKLIKKYIEKEIEENKSGIDLIKKTDYYISYLEITNKLVKTLRKMCIYNPIEVKIAYEYLLYNGYLSIDKKYKFSSENRVNNKLVFGADIMRGTGVCLNISDLLKQIYKSYGFESEIITCNVKKDDKKEEKRLIKEMGYINKFVFENFIGTHVITLVNKNGSTIICDATNKEFINIDKKLNGKYLMHNVNVKILSNYFGLLNNNKKELLELLKQSQELNREEIKKINKGIYYFLDGKEKELNNFHESIKNDIDIICKTLK